MKKDMFDIYNDIGRLYLCHNDIRYSNFLSALLEDQGGLPSLSSLFTGWTYSWRAADFDLMKFSTESNILDLSFVLHPPSFSQRSVRVYRRTTGMRWMGIIIPNMLVAASTPPMPRP
ncbi:hypothetical protein DFS33DRAFT_31852 [Desarmillaria ectypa]|nr:hypothetical protein DFS33DRAFT_31852 [Desarmillaria ectypa]